MVREFSPGLLTSKAGVAVTIEKDTGEECRDAVCVSIYCVFLSPISSRRRRRQRRKQKIWTQPTKRHVGRQKTMRFSPAIAAFSTAPHRPNAILMNARDEGLQWVSTRHRQSRAKKETTSIERPFS